MKIGLLIQRTFNGLNTEYVSENALASFDTKLFLTDERNVAMQLSEAPVFSVAQKEPLIGKSVVASMRYAFL